MVEILCVFPALCALDGACDDTSPLTVGISYAETSTIATLTWGTEPFPSLRVPAGPPVIPGGLALPEQFFAAGGQVTPQVMLTRNPETNAALLTVHRFWGEPQSVSGLGSCKEAA